MEKKGMKLQFPHRSSLLLALVTFIALPVRAQEGGGTSVQTESGGTTTVNIEPAAPAPAAPAPVVPGFPAPGTDLEGHLPSSSKAVVDTSNSKDTFDLNPKSSGKSSYRGQEGSAAFTDGSGGRAGGVPGIHVVRRGDTLWDLCNQYYRDPWAWPRVWSYNPQIQNPHWIYPGDQLRMRLGNGPAMQRTASGFLDRRALVPANTVFLRHQGYIDDPNRDVWGELVGAREDQMLLSEGNHVYMIMRPGVELRLGQLLTLFRKVRQPKRVRGTRKPPGAIVAIKGSVKIEQWDPKTRVARGVIVESLDVIERGMKVGPIGRRFDVVPPRRNDVDIVARILTSIYPHIYMAQNQVAFIDKGSDDGLRPGNRLFIVRRGDTWRRSLRTASDSARERVRQDVHDQIEIEDTPIKGDEKKFPEEVIGELRVLRTRKKSSLTIVTVSHKEFLPGDRAIARKGY